METGKPPQFVVDCMLGRLARWLRILGFDTWYFREIDDPQLVKIHEETGRILLTRDTRMVRCRRVGRRLLIKSDDWKDQLRQVVRDLSLSVRPDKMLTRCLVCNLPLERMAPEEAAGRVPDYVAASTSVFHGCRSCGRVYWAGTHRKRMDEVVSRLRTDQWDGQGPSMG